MVEGTLALAGYLQLYYYPGRALFLGDGEFSRDVPRTVYLDRLHREGVTFVLAQSPDQVGSLAPIWPCLRRVAELPARFVTSRARGTSVPLTLVLFRVRCGSAT